MSRFTVVGASGYIGSRLVAFLNAQGHDVFAPERGDVVVLRQPLGHVVYCAGLTANFRVRPFDTVQAHVCFLADLLKKADFESLLYLSSTRIYMGAECTDEEAPLTVQPKDPSYLYNLSKLTGESLCHASGRSQVRIARLSNVVGPAMNPESGNLIADLIGQARQGHICLHSHPHSMKDYVHVDDVLDALLHIALQGRHAVYNVARGIQTTHGEWLAWLRAQTGCTTEVVPDGVLQVFPVIEHQRLTQEWPQLMRRSIWDRHLI